MYFFTVKKGISIIKSNAESVDSKLLCKYSRRCKCSWECPQCHAKHNRDTNASINILNKGLSIA